MEQNTPILILIGQEQTDSKALLDLFFNEWPTTVATPVICCRFTLGGNENSKNEGITPRGYQSNYIAAEVTRDLKNQHIYFALSPFTLDRKGLLWSFETLLNQELVSPLTVVEHYYDGIGEDGVVLGFGIDAPADLPNGLTFLNIHSSQQIPTVRKILEVYFGPRAALLKRLMNQASESLLQQTGVDIGHFKPTWLIEHDFFQDLSSEKIVEQYSSTENAAALMYRLLHRNKDHEWTKHSIEQVSKKAQNLLAMREVEPVKIWLIGGHVNNLIRLLGEIAKSQSLAVISSRLKIQVTTTIQQEVDSFKETLKQLKHQQPDLENVAQIQTLWRSCVFHSRHNLLTDAPYRSMDLIMCPWIFPALKTEAAQSLLSSLNSSQLESGELLIDHCELKFLKQTSYENRDDTGFLKPTPNHRRHVRGKKPFQYPSSLDQLSSTSLKVRLNSNNQILTSSGNTDLFYRAGLNSGTESVGQSIEKAIRPDLVETLAELLSHVTGQAPRKKLLIAEDQVFLCVTQNQIYDRQHCKFLTIEIIDDVDLHTNTSSDDKHAILSEHIHAMGVERLRAFKSLENLSIQLAADNDRLQTEMEPVKQESERVIKENRVLRSQELSLKHEREFYASIANQSDTPLMVCDKTGTIHFNNQAFSELVGHVDVTHLTDRSLGFHVDNVMSLLHQVFESGERQRIEFLDRNAGSPFELCAEKFSADKEFVLMQVFAKHGNNNTLDFISGLQQMKIGTVILDQNDRIAYIDQQVARWHQSEPSEYLQQEFTSLLHPEFRSLFRQHQEVEANQSIDFEAPLLQKNGKTIWVRIRSLTEGFNDSNQKVLLIENIKRKKQNENQTKVTQKLELLGQITGGVAHDFNNVLAIIIGYIDLMSDEGGSIDREDADRYLTQMRDAAERARNLVKQLLLYSRGDKKGNVVRQNLVAGINETLPLIRTSLQDHIYLTTNISSDQQMIEMDPAHLHQILMNLCINARDAVDEADDREGEIIIGVKPAEVDGEVVCASCHTKIEATLPDDYVILTVTDNGPGMDPATLEQMFDPFFTTKSENKGSGMGLSVVHGLVHQYDGHLQVLNSNYGAQFKIWLPCSTAVHEEIKLQTPTPRYRTTLNWRILIVEDDYQVATVLSNMLAQIDVQVEHCQHGMEALELLGRDTDFKLIITDYSMPGMTGTELANSCQNIVPELPILILSGNSLEIDDQTLPKNVLQVLDKPVTSNELTDAIKFVVDHNPLSDKAVQPSELH